MTPTPPSPSLREVAEKLSEAQRADIIEGRWYLASCDHCGWFGSSQECGTDSGFCDDSDVYCPQCQRSGADGGKIATGMGDAVRQALLSLPEAAQANMENDDAE